MVSQWQVTYLCLLANRECYMLENLVNRLSQALNGWFYLHATLNSFQRHNIASDARAINTMPRHSSVTPVQPAHTSAIPGRTAPKLPPK